MCAYIYIHYTYTYICFAGKFNVFNLKEGIDNSPEVEEREKKCGTLI
jgi:hypothetical protein